MRRTTMSRVLAAVTLAALAAAAAWPTGLAESGTTRTGAAEAVPANRHVGSPAWEDQVIYFVMTDRFHDGNEANTRPSPLLS